jgi:type IV fimbrial biogenesis protein FimT
MAALNYARSEAIRRGVTVSVCKSANGTACGGGTVNWEQGWIVFANTDNDSPAVVDPGEEIIRVHQQLAQSITLRPNANYTNFLTYRPDGRVNNIGTFAICHNNQLAGAKSITITGTGRARFGNDTNNDGIPEKDSGGASVNITSCANP